MWLNTCARAQVQIPRLGHTRGHVKILDVRECIHLNDQCTTLDSVRMVRIQSVANNRSKNQAHLLLIHSKKKKGGTAAPQRSHDVRPQAPNQALGTTVTASSTQTWRYHFFHTNVAVSPPLPIGTPVLISSIQTWWFHKRDTLGITLNSGFWHIHTACFTSFPW